MSCTGCASKFSFLNKERSCQSCNFSFCSKCLNKKLLLGATVCERCFAKKNSDADVEVDPPALLIKRLESLENPAKPPVTMFQSDQKLASLKRGLSIEDQKIVERLEKLKEGKQEQPTVPSESEIKERLQALQGTSTAMPNAENKQNVSFPSSAKTTQEQVDYLLMEYLEQISLDQGTSHLLDGSAGCSNQGKIISEAEIDSEDENEVAARLVARAVEEAALPNFKEEMGLSPPRFSPVEWEPAESELPWCEMCNGNATVRCLGCDGALYCQRCYKQGHDYFELKSHKTVQFKSDSPAK